MIYLDYAATSPVDNQIIDAYADLLRKHFANAASLHVLGARTDSLQTRARQQIGSYLAASQEEIIFTNGASESNNLAIKGVAFFYQNRGKHIITSVAEHPSILNTCKQLEQLFGFKITYLPINEEGVVTLEDVRKAINPETILISLMFVNNETGAINPINEIGKYLHKNHPNIFFHTDATQGFGKIVLDFSNVDLLSMSAHKIYGLKGSGFLLKRKNVQLIPLINGGAHEFNLRGGTSNWPVNVMLAKTIRLSFEQMEEDYRKVLTYNLQIRQAIESIPGIVLNSPINASPYIINLSFINKKSAVIATYFEQEGICVSTVSACSSKKDLPSYVVDAMYHEKTRASSAIRISLGKQTTQEEINQLISVLRKAPEATK